MRRSVDGLYDDPFSWGVEMLFFLVLFLSLLHFVSSGSGMWAAVSPVLTPTNSPKVVNVMPSGPVPAPALSPVYHGSILNRPVLKHHISLTPEASPTSATPPQSQGCDQISCSDPLTPTPIGSPCGCVYPMQVKIDLGVSTFELFPRITDLEVDIAAGTFLKQSQVRIMGASASIQDSEKTFVTIDLVPLGEKFDEMTALLMYDRIWQKKVPINTSLFGDYEVLYVHYPGLPSSPPPLPLGPSGSRSHEFPYSANIPKTKMQKMDRRMIAVIALSSLVVVLICSGLVFILLRLKKHERSPAASGPMFSSSAIRKDGIRSLFSSSLASSISVSCVSTLVTCPPSVKTFSLAELEKATDKFRSSKILGQGGFGRVYHGVMDDGSEVAVKLLTKENQYGDREFIAEVEMLSRLHHRNLVKLIGICIEGQMRCLVYELVRNGSVESHLHGIDKVKGPLDWEARIKIALGAARALAYLHEDSTPRVIHRDFKASNVLLEDDFTPKVSDFGLAREASENFNHISTHVMGTAGLDESTIGAITAWAYKAGDGILDAGSADCAVCLAEFRDGEILRLLPKCGHAFHLSCIDTWLRSHVNCPLCRAPIVAPKSTAYGGVGGGRGPSPPPSSQPSSAANQLDQNLSPASLIDGNQVVNWPSEAGQRGSEMEIDGASLELGVGNGRVVTLAPYSDLEVAIANGEVGIFQPIRRSASMDSLPFALELGERSSAERNKADLEEEQAQKNSKKQGNNSKGHTRTRSSILPL